jgi:hypothetical protein
VTNHLDWTALVVGAIGSLLWAHNGPNARYASVFWLLSSLLWMVFAWVSGLPALGVRDMVGFGTTLYGCFRWMQPGRRIFTAQARQEARSAGLDVPEPG